MTFVKSHRIMVAFALAGLASACAYQYMGRSTRPPGQAPGLVVAFSLEDDGQNGCKKTTPPDAGQAQAGQTIIWRITNNCGRAVTVTIRDVKEKHTTFGGTYPFASKTITVNVPNTESRDLPAMVVREGPRGFHVYTYKIRILPGQDQDPEIIIEWP